MDKNATLHVAALSATKTADGLIDAKLVLSWLVSALGAPGIVVGLLVPVREAGALLPQLALAGRVEAMGRRKGVWVLGSALQGLAALGMAWAALTLTGAVAGWMILACLAALAVARSLCSVSQKDVMARTVEKGTRGRVTGVAGTVAASAVFVYALLLATGLLPREVSYVAGAIALAGALWALGAVLFWQVDEPATDAKEAEADGLAELVAPLAKDPELRTYIATRALLISTALGPPFLVLLGNTEGLAVGNLGLLLLAASLASILSSYLWGWLSDRSSRQTLRLAGALAAVSFAGAAGLGWVTQDTVPSWGIAALVFAAQLAYLGARMARKTHLTDMDTHGAKARYTALSNSVIGVLLLAGGLFGWLADAVGPDMVLALLAALSAGAIVTGGQLHEVQTEGQRD